jgi:hypothetical protein
VKTRSARTRFRLSPALAYWLLGLGSLFWLLVRSGRRPHRLAYPCQRAAAAHAAGFLACQTAGLAAIFSPARLLGALVWLLVLLLAGSVAAPPAPAFLSSPDLPGWTSPAALSNVFVVTHVPEPQYSLQNERVPPGVAPADALRDAGVDALVALMEANGDISTAPSPIPPAFSGRMM